MNDTDSEIQDRYRALQGSNSMWYLEDVFTIVVAAIMVASGVFFCKGDTSAGHAWWTVAFWTAPLPPRPDEPTGSSAEQQLKPHENTPLKKQEP